MHFNKIHSDSYSDDTIKFLFMLSKTYESMKKSEAKLKNAQSFMDDLAEYQKDSEYPAIIKTIYGFNINDHQEEIKLANTLMIEMIEKKLDHLSKRYKILDDVMVEVISQYSNSDNKDKVKHDDDIIDTIVSKTKGLLKDVMSPYDKKYFIKNRITRDFIYSHSPNYFINPRKEDFYNNINNAFIVANIDFKALTKIYEDGEKYLLDLDEYYATIIKEKMPAIPDEITIKLFNFTAFALSPNNAIYLIKKDQDNMFSCYDMSQQFYGANSERILIININDQRELIKNSFMFQFSHRISFTINQKETSTAFVNFTDSLFDWTEEEIRQSNLVITDEMRYSTTELSLISLTTSYILFMPSTGKLNIFSVTNQLMKNKDIISYLKYGKNVTQENYSER